MMFAVKHWLASSVCLACPSLKFITYHAEYHIWFPEHNRPGSSRGLLLSSGSRVKRKHTLKHVLRLMLSKENISRHHCPCVDEEGIRVKPLCIVGCPVLLVASLTNVTKQLSMCKI